MIREAVAMTQKSYRHPGTVPVLSPDDLEILSTAALGLRLVTLQRMPGRDPVNMRGAGPANLPSMRIASKASPHWREAYRAVKAVLDKRKTTEAATVN